MLLTIQDVAKQLQVKASTLYAWVAQGKIPSVKLNGLIRFHPSAIEQWLLASAATVAIHQESKKAGFRSVQDVDRIIAQAKRAVYTCRRGRPDQDRATGKEDGNGPV